MRIVKLTPESKNNILENLLKRSPNSYGKFEAAVNDILANVRARKDEALFEYTKNFDKADINAENVRVTQEEIDEAYAQVDKDLLDVIRKALVNIRDYHAKQKQANGKCNNDTIKCFGCWKIHQKCFHITSQST